jgi:hypothetical protein
MTAALALKLSAALGTALMLVPDAPNGTVVTFGAVKRVLCISFAFLVVAPAEFLFVFRDRCHLPVAADDVRKMLLLVEVLVGLAWATVVLVVVVVLVAGVALVVAVDVAAVEAAGSMGIYSMKSS